MEEIQNTITGTLFANRMSKQGTPLTLEQWIHWVAEGRWQKEVTEARLCLQYNRAEQAQSIKNGLPMLVPNALCTEGRLTEKVTQLYPVAMLDYDRHDLSWATSACIRAQQHPSVIAAYVTFSGGLRLFVNVGPVHPTQWKRMYALLTEQMDPWVGEKSDRACSNLLRTTYPSYDPKAWYRDLNTTLPFPFPADVNLADEYRPSQISPMLHEDPSGDSTITPDTVIDRFFSKYSFHKGERSNRLVFLGQYACWLRLPSHQLDALIQLTFQRMHQPDMKFSEYKQAITWGFLHGEKCPINNSFQPTVSQHVIECDEKKGGAQLYSAPIRVKNQAVSDDEDLTQEQDENEIVQQYCPTFPDEIYEVLPDLITIGLGVAHTKRERDMLLLGMLGVLSGCLPYIRTNYANRIYSPHLYVAVISPAGSGKGIVSLASRLARKINQKMLSEYDSAKRKYKRNLLLWEQEKRAAYKENRQPNWDLEPVEPKRKALLFPPNTSKSQMMIDMEASGNIGMIMTSSEIDALCMSLNTDYGGHTAEIRMIYHHEEIGHNYKIDGRMIIVPCPRMAMCVTGTLEQLVNLVGNIEDGTYSRFLFFTGPSISRWVSAEPDSNLQSGEAVFDELGEKVFDIFNFFNQDKEIHIAFTHEQWERHRAVFGAILSEAVVEGEENITAVVGRHGLGVIRIACVLTALRIYEGGIYTNYYICEDRDFDVAMQMSHILIRHSLQLSTILPRRSKRNRMSSFSKVLNTLYRMNDHFLYSEFVKEAIRMEMSATWAKKALRRLLKEKYIEHAKKGYNIIRK